LNKEEEEEEEEEESSNRWRIRINKGRKMRGR
jgi:hypothetical protein